MQRLLLIAVGLLAVCDAAAQVRTVEEEGELLNWYYAATYGTGVYRAGDRTVSVLQIPLTHTLRAATDERYGLRIIAPVSFGFYNYEFEDVFDQGLPGRIGTVSAMPGVEMEMRVSRQWTLRPYIAAGIGREVGGDQSAWIYDAGLRSRFLIGEDQGVEFSLLNRLSLAGYDPSGAPREPLSLFAIGLDVLVPTASELSGRPIYLSFTPSYYFYFKQLAFAQFDEPDNELGHEVEFAITVSTPKPWTILGIDFDRIGIAVRTGEGVSGFRLFTSLPFL